VGLYSIPTKARTREVGMCGISKEALIEAANRPPLPHGHPISNADKLNQALEANVQSPTPSTSTKSIIPHVSDHMKTSSQ
jgi:hypothetical protein